MHLVCFITKKMICVVRCITHVHRNSAGELSKKRQKYWSVRRYDRLIFKTQQVLGWICAVPLYALTHNQQFRRSVLNFADFAVTLQGTLWTFPHISSITPSLLRKFITSLVLRFTVEGQTTTSIRKNVSDIQVKEYRQYTITYHWVAFVYPLLPWKSIRIKYYDCVSVYYSYLPGR